MRNNATRGNLRGGAFWQLDRLCALVEYEALLAAA